MKSSDIIYNLRPKQEVAEDLQSGVVPPEIEEAQHLLSKTNSEVEIVTKKIQEILNRLIKHSDLNVKIADIRIANNSQVNAMVVPSNKGSILFLNSGLLTSVKSEDELAGVLAHELSHFVMRKKVDHKGKASKTEELGADSLAALMLYNANYNTGGMLDFYKNPNANIIVIDDLKGDDGIKNLLHLVDAHPSDLMRIRNIENSIAIIKRQLGEKTEPKRTKLSQELSNASEAISKIRHEFLLKQNLERIGYFNKNTKEKIEILTALLDEHLKNASDDTPIDRVTEIVSYMEKLDVDFNDQEQKKAFNKLHEVSLKYSIGLSYSSVFKEHPLQIINEVLQKIWEKGNPGEAAKYPGILSEFKDHFTNFFNAKDYKTAENAAKEIIQLKQRIKYLDGRIFEGVFKTFTTIKEAEIKEAIKKDGKYSPPYANHVNWCKNIKKSKYIKEILWGVGLEQKDLWVKEIIGERPKDIDPFTFSTNNNERLQKKLIRDNDGNITEVINQVGPYKWTNISLDMLNHEVVSTLEDKKSFIDKFLKKKNESLNDIKNTQIKLLEFHNAAQVQARKEFEEDLVNKIDWSLVKKDLAKFMTIYGENLEPNYSLVHVDYPFTKRFIEEISLALKDADNHYKAKVATVFLNTNNFPYNEAGIPKNIGEVDNNIYMPFGFKSLEEEIYKNNWPYKDIVPYPKRFTFDHPIIKFALSEQGRELFTDENRMAFLYATKDFLTSAKDKSFAQSFNPPLEQIVNYPKADSISELVQKFKDKNNHYITSAIAVEFERLADKPKFYSEVSIKDLIAIELEISSFIPGIEESSLPEKYKNFKYEVLRYHLLVNKENLATSIENYKELVASGLAYEFPSIKDQAIKRIKNEITREFLDNKEKGLEHLSSLLYKKTYDEKYTYYGYIEDPQIRNWAIKLYVNSLANQLGKDDNSLEYRKKVEKIVKEIDNRTNGSTRAQILSGLATEINAQKSLAYSIRRTYNEKIMKDGLTSHLYAIGAEINVNEATKDPKLRSEILEFLKTPLSDESIIPLQKYISAKYARKEKNDFKTEHSDDISKYQLINYHQNFHSLPLELKILYIEKFLFPVNSKNTDQLAVINGIVNDLCPKDKAEKSEKKR